MAKFSDEERSALLAVKGVGPIVISRLEELGIHSFPDLARREAEDICAMVSSTIGSTCWKNSPQAKGAVRAAILRANDGF